VTITIGLIGAGVMGADHARIIAGQVAGARLVTVSDADEARARVVAAETGAERTVNDPHGVINDPKVGAVLVASPDKTHAEFVLACLKAGKPVLCEKPLAPTTEECMKVIAAETALGKRLVQVGFMRRFDPAYTEMKKKLESGSLGEALVLHCIHRNASTPSFFTPEMTINNSCVHEIDIARWLLSAELTKVQVFKPRSSRHSPVGDPLFVVFETNKGQLVDVELFLNAGYGYDVRSELVCEEGTIALASPMNTALRANGTGSFAIAADWRPRFADAYRFELQAWVNSITSGVPVGASAWDGYVATAVAAAGNAALKSGRAVDISLEQKPALYA
jgi:myo-inositol 2-dehydrogenase/D-chiro-inositol 1-dehydrogenase